ncbi:MAG: hypothetical protein O2954_18330 [bacterium]|nr:hypothetical protein [bacterium]
MFKDRLQKFAHNLVDEFKNATEEIKPRALLNTATDSLKSPKSMVGLNGAEPDNDETRSSQDTIETQDIDDTSAQSRMSPNSGSPVTAPPAPGQPAAVPEGPPGASADFSPAKVQRAPKKREKTAPEESAAPGNAEETTPDPLQQMNSGASESQADQPPPVNNAEAPQDTPPVDFSPAKVQRAPQKRETSAQTEEPPSQDQATNEERAPAEVPQESAQPNAVEKNEKSAVEQRDEATPEPDPGSDKPVSKNKTAPQAKKPPRQQQTGPRLSKTEQALRSFQALQTVLCNPIWEKVLIDPAAKPSALYSPREQFDKQFHEDSFREGLKAANRLATAFSFDPEKIKLNAAVIERVKSFPLDPDGKIKKDSDLLSKVLPEDITRQALGLLRDPQIRHLLFSVATRLGTFVPTIEILARIYLGLRKKADIIPGERLGIQEEVLMRYRKSPYTEDKAKNARTLALNYYTDFLAEHGMKLYKERFAAAPDGQNNIESHFRRHEVIKTHCYNVFEERATRIGLSQPAVIHLKARFTETADLFFKNQVGELPEEFAQNR